MEYKVGVLVGEMLVGLYGLVARREPISPSRDHSAHFGVESRGVFGLYIVNPVSVGHNAYLIDTWARAETVEAVTYDLLPTELAILLGQGGAIPHATPFASRQDNPYIVLLAVHYGAGLR